MQIVFISSRFGRIDLTERVSRWRFSSRAGVGYLEAQFTVNGAERDLHPLMNAVGSDTIEFWAYGQRVWWGYFTGPALAGEGTQANQLQVSAEGPGMRLLDDEVWRIFSDVEYGRWDPEASLPAGFAADNNNRVYVGARGILTNGDSGEVAYPEDGVELGAGLVRLSARVLAGFVAGSFEARIEDDEGNELWSTITDVDEDIDLELDDVDGLALVLECTADGDSDGYVRLTEVRVQTLDPCTPDAIAGEILEDEGITYDAEASTVDVDASVYQGETALIAIQDQEYFGDGSESWLFLVYDTATFGAWPDDATVCAERKHLPRWEVEYRRADVVNAVRVQLPDGWTSDWTTNDASITQWGRREKTLQLSRMSQALAQQYAAVYLDEHAWPISGIKLDTGATILRSDGAPWPAAMVRAGDVLCLRDLIGEERTIRVYEVEVSPGGVQITPQGALNRVEYLLATQKRESEEAASVSGSLSAMATGGASSGDMLKAAYDSNDDGQVDSADDADYLGGVAAAAYMTESEHTAVGDSSPHHVRYADAEAVSAVAAGIHAATGKTTPVDADETALLDSAVSYGLKKLTWANIKATLKTYFDTLYNLYVHPNHSGDVTSSGDGGTTIANKQTLTATAPITVSNTPTVISGAAPVIAISAATTTAHGSVELATVIEVKAGTDTTRAVTAAGVAGIISLSTPATDGGVIKSGAGILTIAAASSVTVTVPAAGAVVLRDSGTSLTAGRIPFASDGNTVTDDAKLWWDNANKYLLVGAEGVSVAQHGLLHVVDSYNGNLSMNVDNIHPSGSVFIALHTLDGAGDPQIGWGIRDSSWVSINHSWHAGIDNSDSDKWKLCQGSIGIAGTTRIAIELTGAFGLMTDNPESNLHIGQSGYIISDDYGSSALAAPYLLLRKSRGTMSSPSAVLADDRLGFIAFKGRYDASTWGGVTAAIIGHASENYGASNNGSYITLELTPTGSTTRAEAIRVTGAKSLLIGTTTDGMTAGGSLAIAQDLAHRGAKCGIFNTTPTTQPTVTGARDNPEEALANLLTAIASWGGIVDSTTAS